MTPIVQIFLILSVAFVAICALNTLDKIVERKNENKGDKQ